MSIASQITRIQNLVSELRTNIINKGVQLASDADLETCVDAVPNISSGGITPSGTISIDTNGTYDVTTYAYAGVNVSGGYTPTGYEAEYFTVTNNGSTSSTVSSYFNFDNSSYKVNVDYEYYYSSDKITWTQVKGSSQISADIVTIPAGESRYIKGFGTGMYYRAQSNNLRKSWREIRISGSNITLSGNLLSLFFNDNFIGQTSIPPYFGYQLFRNNTSLVNLSNLVIKTEDVLEYSLYYLFGNCTNVTSFPVTNIKKYIGKNACCGMFYGISKVEEPDNVTLTADYIDDYGYTNMFAGCSKLKTAPSLPATTLLNYCYKGMFWACNALTTAPSLNNTSIWTGCYQEMFRDCTSLTTPPTLPATTLHNYCYQGMFWGCTALTSAPALNATTLAQNCYTQMFQGCTHLTSAPTLAVTTLANYCYQQMFQGCTALTSAPALNATTLATGCYNSMFYGCTSLTTAPVLPALTLIGQAYYQMFYNCSNLNYIKCLATNVSFYNATTAWVTNVAASGTFVKNTNMSNWATGANGIPADWTIENATS